MFVMCERPGCVAAAVTAGRCAVHASGAGKSCDYCFGSGFVKRRGEADHKWHSEACDRCGGVGLVDAKRIMRGAKAKPAPVDERGLIKDL